MRSPPKKYKRITTPKPYANLSLEPNSNSLAIIFEPRHVEAGVDRWPDLGRGGGFLCQCTG